MLGNILTIVMLVITYATSVQPHMLYLSLLSLPLSLVNCACDVNVLSDGDGRIAKSRVVDLHDLLSGVPLTPWRAKERGEISCWEHYRHLYMTLNYGSSLMLSEPIACSPNMQASLRAYMARLSPSKVESKLPTQAQSRLFFCII
jgi:hypothetical protein